MCEYAKFPIDMFGPPVCEYTKGLCTLCVMGNAKTYKEAKQAEKALTERSESDEGNG